MEISSAFNPNIHYKLTQSYELVEAEFNLSAAALNIFYAIATQINIKEKELRIYTITKSDLQKIVGTELKFNLLKIAIKKLSELSINIADRGKKELDNRALFYSIKYENNKITAEINPVLAPQFINLKGYLVSVDFLKHVSKIKSAYAKRMYIMLKQRAKQKTWVYKIEKLQKILSTPESLRSYGNFKKRVLDRTVLEVNTFTNLHVSYEPIITGRAVTSVRFSIIDNEPSAKKQKEAKNPDIKVKRDLEILQSWYEEE